MHSPTGASLVAAGVAGIGVVLVAFLLPARPRAEQTAAQPAAPRCSRAAAMQVTTPSPGGRLLLEIGAARPNRRRTAPGVTVGPR